MIFGSAFLAVSATKNFYPNGRRGKSLDHMPVSSKKTPPILFGFHAGKVSVERPRVGNLAGQELALPSWNTRSRRTGSGK